jgi:hypothetical protein
LSLRSVGNPLMTMGVVTRLDMPRLHPHAGAIYSVVPLGDGSFGVEVIVPETNPTRVSGFATKIAAGAWIETHKRQVESNLPYRRPKPRGG